MLMMQVGPLTFKVGSQPNYSSFLGFPNSSDGKESACSVGDPGLIPGLGRSPGRRKWQPTPVFLPEKSHGQRSLAGYSLWGRQESDTTEQLHFLSFSFSPIHSLLSFPQGPWTRPLHWPLQLCFTAEEPAQTMIILGESEDVLQFTSTGELRGRFWGLHSVN